MQTVPAFLRVPLEGMIQVKEPAKFKNSLFGLRGFILLKPKGMVT
jgi:hypothetical protein